MAGEGRHRWPIVVALATTVDVGYGTIFYSFGGLLGEDAAQEFSRTVLSASLGLEAVLPEEQRASKMLRGYTGGR